MLLGVFGTFDMEKNIKEMSVLKKRLEHFFFVGLSTENLSVVYNCYLCFPSKQKSPCSVACAVTQTQKLFLVLVGKKLQTMVIYMPNEAVLCTEHAFIASRSSLAVIASSISGIFTSANEHVLT